MFSFIFEMADGRILGNYQQGGRTPQPALKRPFPPRGPIQFELSIYSTPRASCAAAIFVKAPVEEDKRFKKDGFDFRACYQSSLSTNRINAPLRFQDLTISQSENNELNYRRISSPYSVPFPIGFSKTRENNFGLWVNLQAPEPRKLS